MPALHPPVEAPIVRPFLSGGSPFAAGQHRGVDFPARPGDLVHAPCGGRVAFAGGTPSGGAVSLACAGRRYRVTLLPVRPRPLRVGEPVAAGDVVGAVSPAPAGAHAGLHLGVRRPADRLTYLDPAPLLAGSAPPLGPPPPPARVARRPPAGIPPPAPGRVARRPPAGIPPPAAVAPGGATAPAGVEDTGRPSSAGSGTAVAPWPVWIGLALVLVGALGAAGGRGRRRRRPRRLRAAATARRR